MHRPHVLQRLCAALQYAAGPGRPMCIGSWNCRSPRPRRWPVSPRRSTRRCTASPAINAVPWVDFAKGQRKDDVMHEHLARFTGTEGVLFVGRAQEKTKLFRTEKRRDANGDSYPWIVASTGLVNHFYFYCVDDDFGPFFVKFCSYFPYNAKLCLNGNEWAKRQAAKAGIGFTALDNGFATVEDPAAANDLRSARSQTRSTRCCASGWPSCRTRSPRPTGPPATATTCRSCRPSSPLTQMLDKPVSGRMFFEQVIRDNLDIGRPDQVALIFDRRMHAPRHPARHRAGSAPG